MIALKQFLENNRFEKFDCEVKYLDQKVNFGQFSKNSRDDKGWVYAWIIEKAKEPFLILYIGQTLDNIIVRFGGHKSGAKEGNHPKGLSNSKYIIKIIEEYEKT